jgi:ATP-dependent DNA ligase
MAIDGDDLRGLPLSMRKTNLARLLARRPHGIFVAEVEQGGSVPSYSAPLAAWELKAWYRNVAIGPIRLAGRSIG